MEPNEALLRIRAILSSVENPTPDYVMQDDFDTLVTLWESNCPAGDSCQTCAFGIPNEPCPWAEISRIIRKMRGYKGAGK